MMASASLLGLAALALEFGEQRLGFLSQPARLIEFAFDAGLTLVERIGELAVHAEIGEQAEKAAGSRGPPSFRSLARLPTSISLSV